MKTVKTTGIPGFSLILEAPRRVWPGTQFLVKGELKFLSLIPPSWVVVEVKKDDQVVLKSSKDEPDTAGYFRDITLKDAGLYKLQAKAYLLPLPGLPPVAQSQVLEVECASYPNPTIEYVKVNGRELPVTLNVGDAAEFQVGVRGGNRDVPGATVLLWSRISGSYWLIDPDGYGRQTNLQIPKGALVEAKMPWDPGTVRIRDLHKGQTLYIQAQLTDGSENFVFDSFYQDKAIEVPE